jgi:hypothetical protein
MIFERLPIYKIAVELYFDGFSITMLERTSILDKSEQVFDKPVEYTGIEAIGAPPNSVFAWKYGMVKGSAEGSAWQLNIFS